MSIHAQDALHMASEQTFALAAGDPLRAAKVIARALKLQPAGGRRAFVRVMIDALAQNDPTLIGDVAADLHRRRK